MQMTGERLGIVDQFQGVDELRIVPDGSLEILRLPEIAAGTTVDEAAEYFDPANGLHANKGETSAVLAINPDLVDMERAGPSQRQVGAYSSPSASQRQGRVWTPLASAAPAK